MKGHVFNDLVVAIDIGTTKISVLIARWQPNNTVDIVGIGNAPSDGLKKGVVVDIARTVQSISHAVAEAQLMAGCIVEQACIGISGSHIKSFSSQGMVPLKRNQVSDEDIQAVVAAAQAVSLAEGQQILHALPHYFTLDGQDKIQDPRGMYGVRLEANVHIITGSIASAQNLVRCCEQAGIQVTDIVLEQLASARAVLSADERELGVGMLDIGGGTSDLAIYLNGAIRYTHVVPVAGNQFTQDLAIGLQTTLAQAERIKKEFGTVNMPTFDETIIIAGLEQDSMQEIWQSDLAAILEPRASELMQHVKKIIDKKELNYAMTAGFVLTGGGSQLDGLQELAHEILKVPVRIGKPRLKDSLFTSLACPIYATGYGLLLYGLEKKTDSSKENAGHVLSRVASRMKSWVSDFF